MNKFALPILLSAGLLQGCLDSSDSANSIMTLGITDAPIDGAEHVYVQFSGVQIRGSEGTFDFEFEEAKQIDLLELQGANARPLLDGETLPAGRYEQIRLMVDTAGDLDTYIVINGEFYELDIPSGSETGLKLVRGFTLPENGSADFTIDFDVRKSIVYTPNTSPAINAYKLKPALRLVDNVEVGHIYGQVDGTYLTEVCPAEYSAAVYAYEGADATPVEEGHESNAVVASSLVDEQGQYEIGFLTQGEYTVAFTCEAANDMAETLDGITFEQSLNVTVEANGRSEINFMAPQS